MSDPKGVAVKYAFFTHFGVCRGEKEVIVIVLGFRVEVGSEFTIGH